MLCSRVHTPQDDSILGAAGRAALVAGSSGSTDLTTTPTTGNTTGAH